MAETWLPGVERIPGNSGGAMDGDGSRKLLLHSTEGSTIAGAVAAYQANNSWPTLTVDCPDRRAVQHLPLEVAARALRNESGGVQTNREGTVLVQVELVGFAGTPSSIGSPADLDWFGRTVVAAVHRATGVPLVSSVSWRAYPGSYGVNAPQRLTGAAWDAYSGVLGHQHAPENSHGDPGALDVARVLSAAVAAVQPPPVPVPPNVGKVPMAIILAAPGRGPYLVSGSESTPIDGESRDALRRAGVPYAVVSVRSYDGALRAFSAGTQASIEDKLTELAEIESREEQRDLAVDE